MSANVESFDNFDSDAQIAAHQSGLIRIILEGKADLDLFERLWFRERIDTFEFMESKQLVTGSGCTAVKSAVEYSITTDHIPAAGIVDRDSLFREGKWDILYEVDNDKFLANSHIEDIHVASLWEVEAYMLEPDLLYSWVHGSHRSAPGPVADCEMAITRTIAECEFLLAISYFFAASHAVGNSIPDSYFHKESLGNAEKECSEKCSGLDEHGKAIARQVKALIENICGNYPENDSEKLRYLLRYVDTKRLLKRLAGALQVKTDTHWILPILQAEKGRSPSELKNFLEHIESKYAT